KTAANSAIDDKGNEVTNAEEYDNNGAEVDELKFDLSVRSVAKCDEEINCSIKERGIKGINGVVGIQSVGIKKQRSLEIVKK
ncbi:17058_t:CDS:2, partial [Funneliformis geosporum]